MLLTEKKNYLNSLWMKNWVWTVTLESNGSSIVGQRGQKLRLHWNKSYGPESCVLLVCKRIWWHNITGISVLQVDIIRSTRWNRTASHSQLPRRRICSCRRLIVSSETTRVTSVCWLDNAMTYAGERTLFCSPSFFVYHVPSSPLLLACSQC